MQIDPRELAIPKLHEYLLSAVAPRPIAFVSTIDAEGRYNLAPFSFFNVFGSNPPIMIFSPARSGRTGQTKHTHDNVAAIPECVVNIAHYGMIHQMNLAAGMYPEGVDEFVKSGLTPAASIHVKPPRVAESYVSFECRVNQVIETGTGGGAGNLIVCEVLMIHIQDQVINAEGSIDPYQMDYIARMGKQHWCRIGADNMFTMPGFKLANELGMGYDGLPEAIRQSSVLTGNDLAQLAYHHAPPSVDEIATAHKLPDVIKLMNTYPEKGDKYVHAQHLLAQQHIAAGDSSMAWCILSM
jgi:flavin reductase (DIM6/NTAB) family NADH-FMN oxidoreductase RutF